MVSVYNKMNFIQALWLCWPEGINLFGDNIIIILLWRLIPFYGQAAENRDTQRFTVHGKNRGNPFAGAIAYCSTYPRAKLFERKRKHKLFHFLTFFFCKQKTILFTLVLSTIRKSCVAGKMLTKKKASGCRADFRETQSNRKALQQVEHPACARSLS